MINIKNSKLTPTSVSAFTEKELIESLAYFTTALDETIDSVFLAQQDPKFLTDRRIDDLKKLQTAAQTIAEVVAFQIIVSEVSWYFRT